MENYHLPTHELAHNDSEHKLPQLAWAALLCAAWQAAPSGTEMPAFWKLVNELLQTHSCRKDLSITWQMFFPKIFVQVKVQKKTQNW